MTTFNGYCEPFVEQLRLVQAGLDVSLHRSLFEVLPWYVVVIHFAAIFAMGPPPGIGADVREVQSSIASQPGNQMQIPL